MSRSRVYHHALKLDRYASSFPATRAWKIYRDGDIDNTSRIEVGPVTVYG